MDEASAYVKAKAQQPHDQKNRENCPKHVDPPLLTPSLGLPQMGAQGTLVITWDHSRVSPVLLTWLVTIAQPSSWGGYGAAGWAVAVPHGVAEAPWGNGFTYEKRLWILYLRNDLPRLLAFLNGENL